MKMTFKMWILAVVLVATLFAINPTGYFKDGVLVKSVDQNSSAYIAGLSNEDIIKEINGVSITSMQDYSKEIESLFSTVKAVNWTIETNKETYIIESLTLNLEVDENLKVISSSNPFSEITSHKSKPVEFLEVLGFALLIISEFSLINSRILL